APTPTLPQRGREEFLWKPWIPAFAGMTGRGGDVGY
ncbi:MAG: hypothetical protein K0S48_3760, partial [Ramlibacter sp.]|nr:hypothetical protein [Ramlibacter sp.]